MNKKVEELLNSISIKMYPSREDAERAIKKRNKELAKQICHLFPKSPENPDGYETGRTTRGKPTSHVRKVKPAITTAPKPDRLLSDEELAGFGGEINRLLVMAKEGLTVDVTALLEAQRDLTASIKDAECQRLLADCIEIQKAKRQQAIDEVFGEIEKCSQDIDENGNGTDNPLEVVETIYYIGKGRLRKLKSKLKRVGGWHN